MEQTRIQEIASYLSEKQEKMWWKFSTRMHCNWKSGAPGLKTADFRAIV
jgi:hypothetical protein